MEGRRRKASGFFRFRFCGIFSVVGIVRDDFIVLDISIRVEILHAHTQRNIFNRFSLKFKSSSDVFICKLYRDFKRALTYLPRDLLLNYNWGFYELYYEIHKFTNALKTRFPV